MPKHPEKKCDTWLQKKMINVRERERERERGRWEEKV
jgi:hypothetical protein